MGGKPLPKHEVEFYSKDVPDWNISEDNKKISRQFVFKDFKQALNFVNNVGNLAENEGHHPDILVHWNKVTLDLWTHAVGGLSLNDFILAAKIDRLKE